MWLINAKSLRLEQVCSYSQDEVDHPLHEPVRPRYAILSHRWRDQEVTFRDMIGDIEARSQKQGYQKIVQCCSRALAGGIDFVWIDTCCINKESTVDLSEAINSMYRWYRDAETCFTLLDDIETAGSLAFEQAEFWRRGWCLQELLAPAQLTFFNRFWEPMGDRATLSADIAKITGIDVELLSGLKPLDKYSIAQKMSWASERKTTRPEDKAYCLLGIFDISMPILYGEGGDRAFQRLQAEIILNSDDHSIFAWRMSLEPNNHGMLARSPMAFLSSGSTHQIAARHGREPYSITNRGVSITLSITPWSMNTYLAILNSADHSVSLAMPHDQGHIGIFLRQLPEDNAYVRVSLDGEDIIHNAHSRCSSKFTFRSVSINVRQTRLSAIDKSFIIPKVYGFRISDNLLGRSGKASQQCAVEAAQGCKFDRAANMVLRESGTPLRHPFATIDLTNLKKKIKRMRLFLDDDFNPICFMAEASAVNEEVRLLDKAGQLNIGERSARQWSDVEYVEFQSFDERVITTGHGWNAVSRLSTGRLVARENTFRTGLWQLRGDRVDGLDMILLGLGGEDEQAHLTIKLGESARGPVWDVDVQHLASTSTRSNLKGIFR